MFLLKTSMAIMSHRLVSLLSALCCFLCLVHITDFLFVSVNIVLSLKYCI